MKRNHRHADMIRRWLDDDSLEIETELPGESGWKPIKNPAWHEDCMYRFKPKMIKVNGHEFPAPVGFDPDRSYYSVLVTVENNTTIAGLHETKFAAEAHAKALLSITDVKQYQPSDDDHILKTFPIPITEIEDKLARLKK